MTQSVYSRWLPLTAIISLMKAIG